MNKSIDKDTLIATPKEEWYELYESSEDEMFALAKELLESSDGEDINLGIEIIKNSWQDEDSENPETSPILWDAPYEGLVAPLQTLLKNDKYTLSAVYCLLVGCRQDPEIIPEASPILDAFGSKVNGEIDGMDIKDISIRVLTHIYGRENDIKKVFEKAKGTHALGEIVFDELTFFAAGGYDLSPLTKDAYEGVKAEGGAKVRTSIELLVKLAKSGVDISEIVPYLFENQEKLTQYTDVLPLLGIYYLKTKKYDDFQKWLDSTDPSTKTRACLAFNWAKNVEKLDTGNIVYTE
jgi:hypothetical protein